MSASMHWFRRYQKVFLAVLGVLLMFGFVLWEPLFRLFTSNPAAQNPVVVRTNFENLTERDLQNLRESRILLNRFLDAFSQLAAQNLSKNPQFAQIPPDQLRNLVLRTFQNEGLFGSQFLADEALVQDLVLDHKAHQLGMNISNDAIFDYLQQHSANSITSDQLRALLANLQIPQRRIFDTLRNVLLSSKLRQIVFGLNSFVGTPPGLRFDYFERLDRKINAEVLPVNVASFVDKAPTPSDAELRALYEKYKNQYPDPDSSEPGFRVPPKGKFEGFKAQYDDFAKTVQVTDKEIEEHYEKYKDRYRYSNLDDEPSSTPVEDAGADSGSTTEQPAATEADATSPPPADENTEGPATSEPKAEEGTATPNTAEPSSTEPAANPEAGTPDSAEAKSPGGGGDDTGSATETPAATETAPAENSPPTEPAPAETAAPTEPPAATPPTATETSSEGSATAPDGQAPTATAEAAVVAEPAAPVIEPDDSLILPLDISQGPDPEHDPLWKVEEQIRKELIGEAVKKKIDAVFDVLAAAMEDYANAMDLYELSKDDPAAKTVPAPTKPDFAKLASEQGVQSFVTELITPLDAQSSDLGESTKAGRPFVQFAFEQLKPYVPEQSENIEGDRFLFWKTEESKDEVPDFDKAKPAVLAAWKIGEARKLALAHAQELAAKAEKEGKSLKELYGDDPKYPVTETGYFSWMIDQSPLAAQMGQSQPQLSTVSGVQNPGPEFMRAVSALAPGQIGTAMNQPETVVYVVRVVGQEPTDEELYAKFLKEPYQQYLPVAREDANEYTIAWAKLLEEEAGVQWERPADNRSFSR